MDNRKKRIYLILTAVLIAAAIAVVLFACLKGSGREAAAKPGVSEQVLNEVISTQSKPSIIKEKKTIDVETIRDGLSDIGFLITQEYCFTEVVDFSSVKTFLNIPLGFTESNYVAGYDGTVTAGIDFTKVSVDKNDDEKVITVHMPRAEIKNVDIDPDSFVLYSEKNGLGNPTSISDYNDSLTELENKAENKAISRGMLEKAEENARAVVKNFITGLAKEYEVKFI